MQAASFSLDHWPRIVGHIASLVDLDASARTHRALLRKRGVPDAAALLHLALIYGPGGKSLRTTASLATETRIAELGDVSLLFRLRKSGDFLEDVLNRLLADARSEPLADGQDTPRSATRLGLVDGSTVSIPGSKGANWRLHARYEPARGRFTDLTLTDVHTAEASHHTTAGPGDVLIQDRGYGRVRNFTHARARGADFVTRIGWRAVTLFHPSGEAFDLLAAAPESGAAVVEHTVRIGNGPRGVDARLIIARKPGEATAREAKRVRRRASRSGRKTDPRTVRAAGFMMLLTSLSPERATGEEVLRLYRMRWQVELAFKRLKSLGGFAALRASDPALARSWLLAHLIAAVLIETFLSESLDSPPRAWHRSARAPAASLGGLGDRP